MLINLEKCHWFDYRDLGDTHVHTLDDRWTFDDWQKKRDNDAIYTGSSSHSSCIHVHYSAYEWPKDQEVRVVSVKLKYSGQNRDEKKISFKKSSVWGSDLIAVKLLDDVSQVIGASNQHVKSTLCSGTLNGFIADSYWIPWFLGPLPDFYLAESHASRIWPAILHIPLPAPQILLSRSHVSQTSPTILYVPSPASSPSHKTTEFFFGLRAEKESRTQLRPFAFSTCSFLSCTDSTAKRASFQKKASLSPSPDWRQDTSKWKEQDACILWLRLHCFEDVPVNPPSTCLSTTGALNRFMMGIGHLFS